jgi:transcriptional regulator with XRE-family HTH domain
MTVMTSSVRPSQTAGELLREWRERRRLSQLELSLQAEISTRHLSFVETGRSKPTPQMILKLTEHLEVPLRERNAVLLAGGYAPAYPDGAIDGPEQALVRDALRHVLAGHSPHPAVVVNRWWELIDANPAVALLTKDSAPWLLEPPINVLRLALHPEGMASRIMNLPDWRGHLLLQLQQRARTMGDPRLQELHNELVDYPGGRHEVVPATGVVLPLRYRYDDQELSLFSISASVTTATDVTVQELAIEAFYPADSPTASYLATIGNSTDR